MPISGPSSYVPTAEEFIAHRANADAELGAGNEIVLPDGSDAAAMVAKKDELVAKRTELTGKINDKEGARGDVEIKKAAIQERIVQFNEKVRAFFPAPSGFACCPMRPARPTAKAALWPRPKMRIPSGRS